MARRITYIIPCGAAKADHSATARELYTSDHFAYVLRTAESLAADDLDSGRTHAARVLIMSARHGLVDLDTVLAPYDTTMGEADAVGPGAIAAQGLALELDDDEVYALVPRRYFEVLSAGLQAIYAYPQDVYEATAGVGDQRGVCRSAAA